MDSQELFDRSEELYDRYGKPLESEHWGRFVAIHPNGRTVLGEDVDQVLDEATIRYGPGSFLFKVGEREVGRWR